ncbi:hypothetical protein BJ508DRAFT_412429 [Ascobolus immersus RN42]|uniref:CENP-V/GFA domain-containing protein n=1 Tax=Ascobolus immersus RN42 TaxID=1160509 RepID=A0A3N4IGW3_ASCIM|nr:hypothetical protein BJ508DRAFT_412429 [Ascobolus immersus RN42]
MPVTLHGSCHCGAVRYTVDSSTPVPYQMCSCSICRKLGGPSGSINLGGYNDTLKILQGKDDIRKYKAVLNRDTPDEKRVNSERSFCGKCGSMLWLFDSSWPELIHPFATSIDSPTLEEPKTMVCVKQNSKAPWARLPEGPKEVYDDYGGLSIEEWHKKNGKFVE